MRDSGLDISFALRQESIDQKRNSFLSATKTILKLEILRSLIPTADLVLNLTPDKNHTSVVNTIMPLMKKDLYFLIHMDLIL